MKDGTSLRQFVDSLSARAKLASDRAESLKRAGYAAAPLWEARAEVWGRAAEAARLEVDQYLRNCVT